MATESGDSRHGGYGHECWDGCDAMTDKPPDRAEWKRRLSRLAQHELTHREPCDGCAVHADQLVAAIQRALDERMIPCMDDDCADSHILCHEARKNDGES